MGGGTQGYDLSEPKRGTIIHVRNRPNANSGGYWGMVFKKSAIEDDLTFTITASSGNNDTKINGVYARGQTAFFQSAGGSNRPIYAYNANLKVATFTGAQIKSALSAAELSTYDYISVDFSTYAGDGCFTFEIT